MITSRPIKAAGTTRPHLESLRAHAPQAPVAAAVLEFTRGAGAGDGVRHSGGGDGVHETGLSGGGEQGCSSVSQKRFWFNKRKVLFRSPSRCGGPVLLPGAGGHDGVGPQGRLPLGRHVLGPPLAATAALVGRLG